MADAQTLRSAFERNEAALKQHPSVGQKTGKVKVRSHEGLACDIESGHGRSKPTCPGRWAARLGVPVDGIEIEVEFDADVRFLFGVGGVPAHWSAIRYRVTVESDAPEADVRRVLDLAHRQSHIRGDLEHPFEIEREVNIVAPTR